MTRSRRRRRLQLCRLLVSELRMVKSRNILPPKRFWTADEESYLRAHYVNTLTVDLARQLGCGITRVLAKANSMGLKKSKDVIAETARERSNRPGHGSQRTRIQAGQEPWNKGLHYLAGGRSAETRFKPGIRPHTWVPIGSYRTTEGGRVLEQKVNDLPGPNSVRWKPVSRLVWEAAHGPVPAGHLVVFKPGRQTADPALITLDALECIDRRERMRRNSLHTIMPPELRGLVQLRGVLARTINSKAKGADET